MKKQKELEAMIMSIVIILIFVLVFIFVVKCVQMKKKELNEYVQVQSETETDDPEQTTEETTEAETELETDREVPDDHPVNGPEEETTEEIQTEPETAAAVRDTLGCPEEILIELRARLTAYGIEWWEPYALAQMFQESRFGIYVENRNGLDKGLLQYRVTYWSALCTQHGLPSETSIFDWKAQLNIYVQDTARRLGSGCSVQDTISRHMMSDYGPYCETYVNDVMRWVR